MQLFDFEYKGKTYYVHAQCFIYGVNESGVYVVEDGFKEIYMAYKMQVDKDFAEIANQYAEACLKESNNGER